MSVVINHCWDSCANGGKCPHEYEIACWACERYEGDFTCREALSKWGMNKGNCPLGFSMIHPLRNLNSHPCNSCIYFPGEKFHRI